MKTFLSIKSICFNLLKAGALLLLLSSCTTAPVKTLASGELRLLKIQQEGKDDVRRDFPVKIAVNFEADGKPEITTICFYWGSDGPYFYKNLDVDYGPPGTIHVEIIAHTKNPNNSSTVTLESYVMYVLEGKNQLSNTVSTPILVLAR